MLYSDGRLTCSEKKGAAPKYTYMLTARSKISAIPRDELKGERGFFITFGGNDVLCVKSAKLGELEVWDNSIRDMLIRMGTQQVSNQERLAAGLNASEVYSSTMSNPNLIQKSPRKESSRRTGGQIRGYTMKVGKSKSAGDFFVNANTFEYFKSEEDCARGLKPVGKATLNLLV